NSYWVELPPNLKSRGIHDVFHASLLCIHKPNNDRLFPGQSDAQFIITDEEAARDLEWEVNHILCHKGKVRSSVFEIEWKSGDNT
ncbi:hypothetical protein GLOTRDRAFT_14673, partial [Gloeophyllum trabeum ATCC 11539]